MRMYNIPHALIIIARDPSAEGTGRKGASYLDKSLFPN